MTTTGTNATGTDRLDAARPHTTPSARLVTRGRVLHVVGGSIEVLTPLAAADELPCLLRADFAAGGFVPLHSHADPETFVGVTGEIELLAGYPDATAWVPLRAGDIFHVPGDVPHAWRHPSDEPATALLLTTTRLARFFSDVAAPASRTNPPDPEVLATYMEATRRYGYWKATPEENAAVGLRFPASP
jgi:mannose-6-phosphate isomerase-like protein (cupin superfamily)